MTLRDISDPISYIIGQIFSIMFECLNMLDLITFNGITLLDYLIMLTLLAFIIPLLISRAKTADKERRVSNDD